MFMVFDNVRGDPLIVKVKKDKKSVPYRAVILCTTREAATKALRQIFGGDDDWNRFRFNIQKAKKDLPDALQEVIDCMGVHLFCDETGKVRNREEVLKETK